MVVLTSVMNRRPEKERFNRCLINFDQGTKAQEKIITSTLHVLTWPQCLHEIFNLGL